MKQDLVLILASVAILSNLCESKSILQNILDVDLVSDTSSGLVKVITGALNSGLQFVDQQVSEARQCLDDVQSEACGELDPDAKRNVSEIIRSRGFECEEFSYTTRDGYILTVQRIVNPLVSASYRKKLKPVILQHGLMSSSVDWVINSVKVRPTKFPGVDKDKKSADSTEENITGDSQEHPNGLGFYLANRGYDVYLANSRGNIYGQRHVNLSSWMPSFWSFTFDEQIEYDLPDLIETIRSRTNKTKVGYVGHSQGTTMALGLLAERPEFAEVLEPVVLLAPVAYASHCLSPVKYFAIYTPIFQHVDMWFGSSNAVVRYLGPIVCGPDWMKHKVCTNIVFLATGFDADQFDESRASAYLNHMPSGTSVKNIAHWGQMVLSGRFAHFDKGLLSAGNIIKKPPAYELANIRSKSLALFTAENDWLASPKDVARLRAELRVPIFRMVNVTEFRPKWNHIDFVYGKDAGKLVNARILEIFDHFNQ